MIVVSIAFTIPFPRPRTIVVTGTVGVVILMTSASSRAVRLLIIVASHFLVVARVLALNDGQFVAVVVRLALDWLALRLPFLKHLVNFGLLFLRCGLVCSVFMPQDLIDTLGCVLGLLLRSVLVHTTEIAESLTHCWVLQSRLSVQLRVSYLRVKRGVRAAP